MKEEQNQFLRLLGQVPARLTGEQVASPSVKFFAASELLEQVQDRTWLAKVTKALNQHWQKRHAAKRKHLTGEAEKMHSRTESMGLR